MDELLPGVAAFVGDVCKCCEPPAMPHDQGEVIGGRDEV